MASKLKNLRQRNQVDQSLQSTEKPTDSNLQTDRRPSTVKEDGDEFPVAPNIAVKIAQRRLPRRTPTSHVKGVSGDLIRRRLSKTNDEPGSSRPNRYTFESSFEKSFDESDEKTAAEPEKPSEEKSSETPQSSQSTEHVKQN